MSKIVRAVNSMISNAHSINSVEQGFEETELFFLYDNKYKWSISRSSTDNNYYLHYYPGAQSLKELASIPSSNWQYFREMVTYSTLQIKTEEAYQSFAELYTKVVDKLWGMDDVLDGIIKGDEEIQF